MKRNIKLLLDEAKNKLSGYLALLGYRLMNLCVKAEPASLLSMEVEYGDDKMPIDSFVTAYRPDDYHFMIIPNDPKMMKEIAKAIATSHPEFKQEIKQLDEKDSEEEPTEYFYITMPDVDDDRYKVLTDAVTALCDSAKSRMELTYNKYLAEMTAYLISSPKEEQEEAKNELQNLYDRVVEATDQYKTQKETEIEEAHSRYLAGVAEKESQKQNEEKAKGKSAGMSMRLFDEEDE